jgi:hydrogenase maturation protein HypF
MTVAQRQWRYFRPDCWREYRDPADRRFHAEPIACPACGPQLALVRLNGGERIAGDPIDAAARLIADGEILAIKGLGGYQLACDAANAEAVARLRRLKQRDAKPFALMARDRGMIRRYCRLMPEEERALTGAAAPIVLLPADGPERLPEAVAPGLRTLGFMLPTTPLHLLLLHELDRPLVMTSGNLSDEPQAIEDRDAALRLGGIAGYALIHNREIANRVDRFGGAGNRRQNPVAAPRTGLCAGADRFAAGLRERARDPGDGRRVEGDLLPGQGREGDPVAASG